MTPEEELLALMFWWAEKTPREINDEYSLMSPAALRRTLRTWHKDGWYDYAVTLDCGQLTLAGAAAADQLRKQAVAAV